MITVQIEFFTVKIWSKLLWGTEVKMSKFLFAFAIIAFGFVTVQVSNASFNESVNKFEQANLVILWICVIHCSRLQKAQRKTPKRIRRRKTRKVYRNPPIMLSNLSIWTVRPIHLVKMFQSPMKSSTMTPLHGTIMTMAIFFHQNSKK